MRLIQEFFKFNRNERRGLSCLLILVAILCYFRYRDKIIVHVYPNTLVDENVVSETVSLDTMNIKLAQSKKKVVHEKSKQGTHVEGFVKSDSPRKQKKLKKETSKFKLDKFNPNKVDSITLTKMGINRFAISNWMKFRRKGGRIFTEEKLQSIYALKSDEFDRIKAYAVYEKKADNSKSEFEKFNKKENPLTPIDINSATAQDFQRLRGIGPVFSERIVKFRDLLGGFIALDQLKEVYGIEDSLYQSIIPYLSCATNMEKQFIPINEITQDSLKKHPYISWKQAKLIVRYRDVHGDFSSEEEFRKLRFLKEDDFRRIIPYLDFRPYTGTAL